MDLSDATTALAPQAPARALTALGTWLARRGYAFATVTPATHARVNGRAAGRAAASLGDVFGWNRPFGNDVLPPEIMALMGEAGLLAPDTGGLHRSRVRFATLGGQVFAHSSFPTTASDAIFFGPDTYRFVNLIHQELDRLPLAAGARVLDMGCGAGPGGILAALHGRQPVRLSLADINPVALDFARANAGVAGMDMAGIDFAQGDLYGAVAGDFDLVVSNPPYLNDGDQRLYRHGGGPWGGGLSERIVNEGLARLRPGGRLVLYTGSAIVHGQDPLRAALLPALSASGMPWTYRELDPDVFGEELDQPAYAGADRIAAVALVVRRPSS